MRTKLNVHKISVGAGFLPARERPQGPLLRRRLQCNTYKIFIFLFASFLLLTANFLEADDKMLLGVVERVVFMPENITLSAKLDTGAKSSSLNATDIQITEENHQQWVSFLVTSKKGQFHFKKPLEGYVKIKVRHAEKTMGDLSDDFVSRPVVLMEIRLGERQQLIEVNLENRNNFIYPFLLGRDAITQLGGVVDPSQRYTIKRLKLQKQSNLLE